jgi:fructose-1,6-bisphosphatase/inositol monophosphatase family enzyme
MAVTAALFQEFGPCPLDTCAGVPIAQALGGGKTGTSEIDRNWIFCSIQ